MKKNLVISLLLFTSLSSFAFGTKEVVVNAEDKLIAGLILNPPGIGDESINDDCYKGLKQAADEGLFTLRVKTSPTVGKSADILTEFATEGVDIIYSIGDSNKKILLEASRIYKDIIFIGVDINFSDSDLSDNLYGTSFKEQDGGYLAGLLAGSLTYSYNNRHEYLNDINRVGVVLGKNLPDLKRYELGFYAGVKKVNPACEVISIDINDLSNPVKGVRAVNDLKDKGVDIIFSLAGDSEKGVFKAAEENNIFVIGANKDLSGSSKNILTSVVKNMSVPTYQITRNYLNGLYESGTNIVYGLDEGAISLAPFYNLDKYIPKDLRVVIKDMSKKLGKGSEKIPEDISLIEFNPLKVPDIES